jgi:hypothetical protein
MTSTQGSSTMGGTSDRVGSPGNSTLTDQPLFIVPVWHAARTGCSALHHQPTDLTRTT